MKKIKKKDASKKITLEKLAAMMADGFAQAKKDNEDLAIMVQHGFEENDKRFAKLEQGQAKLEQGQAKLEQGQAKLEQGQEEMKMRLSNVAYRFELVDLQKRVQKVEDIVLARKIRRR